uniref:Peptidyl-prolyl cis-trans isomerase n=1 Tax=Haptolina ericina TaxID=156174 RepID=A0A7S3EX89_9EUKA|mmetsp:Transcript_33406/g.75532  ORF Transcript_33406/g.75532 Transcript_33406/m.75532 type:complete len:118 (+) Transcript_33406:116-469(+)|eukprot:CAMPEP_0181211948 /NCGR_PEP_ID=MMETSP1096-20121128/24074_1 /TAXON_ID=156174 ORGANISM="Chrysochromulina ericina, Strain CCMP281" /NCGR_SAMPLE_ID=MMETSP1096 /ASSEMBLY_ACC=CAM_ASM_000453 /LENGTH=117 /DNA_ID=CAMNT_0023303415 /DNA_START=113 /DNA_END=466 /DNA_ORIENTATION=+
MSVVAARHLLIKFSGSRNPVSRRTGQSTASVTDEQAIAELTQYAEKIKSEGATEAVFAKYAEQRSDCGSFKQGGDLGAFGPGEMQKQFEDGTRNCAVGEMSPIVLSDSGYHLIFRTK